MPSVPKLPVTEVTQRVADDLRILREVSGMSRAEVSRRVGLSQSMGNDIFRGDRSPTLDELTAICRVLGTTMMDVLSGEARKRI